MKIKTIITGMLAAVLLLVPAMGVCASDGEEYITITVEASDDNEEITYALDSDDPGSFGASNTFTMQAGIPHTIYVKDAAGNITSQIYEPPAEAVSGGKEISSAVNKDSILSSINLDENTRSEQDIQGTVHVEDENDGQTISIDLELGGNDSDSGNSYELKKDIPAEQGEGTVYSKTFLDGTDKSEQVFYSMTTEEGDVFYLLIDQGQESNNVYLLNQVSNQDLDALVDGGSTTDRDDKDDSLLSVLSAAGGGDDTDIMKTEKKGINTNTVIMLLLMAAGGGFYYYQKIYKTKKEQEIDAMEAPDMDQFSASEDETDDDFDFDYGEDDKEQYLENLIREEEEEYAAAAERDAKDAGWDTMDRTESDTAEADIFSDIAPGGYDPEIDDEEE